MSERKTLAANEAHLTGTSTEWVDIYIQITFCLSECVLFRMDGVLIGNVFTGGLSRVYSARFDHLTAAVFYLAVSR